MAKDTGLLNLLAGKVPKRITDHAHTAVVAALLREVLKLNKTCIDYVKVGTVLLYCDTNYEFPTGGGAHCLS